MTGKGRRELYSSDLPVELLTYARSRITFEACDWNVILTKCTEQIYGPIDDAEFDAWEEFHNSGLRSWLRAKRQVNPAYWIDKEDMEFNMRLNGYFKDVISSKYKAAVFTAIAEHDPDYLVDAIDGLHTPEKGVGRDCVLMFD